MAEFRATTILSQVLLCIVYHVGCFTILLQKEILRGKDNHGNGSSARQVLTLKVLVELN